MRARWFLTVLACLLLQGALAAQELSNEEMAVEEMARVITSGAPPVDCIASVEIDRIDGENKAVSKHGFDIEPGQHSLNGRALIDTTWCELSKNTPAFGPVADLEINFQAGRTYYIGFDHHADNPQEWQLVVWKVE